MLMRRCRSQCQRVQETDKRGSVRMFAAQVGAWAHAQVGACALERMYETTAAWRAKHEPFCAGARTLILRRGKVSPLVYLQTAYRIRVPDSEKKKPRFSVNAGCMFYGTSPTRRERTN